MAAWRYKISLLMLKKKKRNFVSQRSHVISFIYYSPPKKVLGNSEGWSLKLKCFKESVKLNKNFQRGRPTL